MKPLILTAALTGAGPVEGRHRHRPRSPREIVDAALSAWRAGASVVHIHGRTEDGAPSADPALHRAIAAEIRAQGCDVVINFSAGDGGGRFGHEERLELIGAGGEIASFTPASYNSGKRIYDNGPAYVRRALARMRADGVRPEIEILEVGFVGHLQQLIDEGELAPPFNCLFVFGVPGAMPADPALLAYLRPRLPAGTEWSVACAGQHAVYAELAAMALHSDGHVRTGLEDHAELFPGSPATSNAALVDQWVKTACIWGRPIASPAQARELLGLQPLNASNDHQETRRAAASP